MFSNILSMSIKLLSCFAYTVCVCMCMGTLDSRVHGMSFDLPLQCAAVIGCDTSLSALPGGHNRNLTIMAPVMNMSQQLQTMAHDLDKTPLYVVSVLIHEINAAWVN